MQFNSSLQILKEVNDTFDIGILRIAYPERNRNKTCITKDVFEKCKHTLYNCPIVANYDPAEDSIGGHDVEFMRDDDGALKLINITHPVGCVPESANIYWETIKGKQYLVTEVLLWKRQPAYSYIKKHGFVKHSMEIEVKQGKIVDGIYIITDFVFMALCLLGDSEEPCFEESALQVFTLDSIQREYIEMMNEVRQIYAAQSNKEDNAMKEKLALLEQFGLSQDKIDFDIESLDIEELQIKLAEFKSQNDDKQFSLNILEMLDEVSRLVSSEETCWDHDWEYEYPRYFLVEIQAEENEVIVCDAKDGHKIFGVPMIIDGDMISLDFDNKKRKKTKYIDFEDGSKDDLQPDWFMEYMQMAKEKYNLVNAELSDKQNDLEQMQQSFDVMKQEFEDTKYNLEQMYSQKRLEEIHQVFDMFDYSLGNVEEYMNLKAEADASAYTPEEIREKCFVILGKKELASFAKQAGSHKSSNDLVSFNLTQQADVNQEPYHGLYQKYGYVK